MGASWEEKWLTARNVALLACGVGLLACWYFHHTDRALWYGDALARLNAARRVTSSLTPGLVQLGSVWPPLPQVVMLPFIWAEPLWRSGLAGIVPSFLCFVGSAVLLFRLNHFVTNDRAAAFLGALFFLANPNLLYLQATPMSESLALLSLVGLAFFLSRWAESQRVFDLAAAAFFAFMGTLTRYELWAVTLLAALLVVFVAWRRTGDWASAEGSGLTFLTLAAYGMVLWLLYNAVIFGDLLYFARSPYSARAQAMIFLHDGKLPAYHDLPRAGLLYGAAVGETCGWITAAIALLGAGAHLRSSGERTQWLPACLLLAPGVFHLLTLYGGQCILLMPQFPPHQLFNARYGLFLLPTGAFLVAWLAARSHATKGLCVALLAAQLFVFLWVGEPITMRDARDTSARWEWIGLHEWLKVHYAGGLILVATGGTTFDVPLFHSELPMRAFISEGQGRFWRRALEHPEEMVFLVVTQEGDAIWENVVTKPTFPAWFKAVFVRDEVHVYQRRSDAIPVR